jgi:hypothetical protein
MNVPTAETATVYRGGRRRWLSLHAASRAEARARINERCDCDKGRSPYDEEYSPHVCIYHADLERFGRIVERLARWYERAAKKATA